MRRVFKESEEHLCLPALSCKTLGIILLHYYNAIIITADKPTVYNN